MEPIGMAGFLTSSHRPSTNFCAWEFWTPPMSERPGSTRKMNWQPFHSYSELGLGNAQVDGITPGCVLPASNLNFAARDNHAH